MNDWSWVEMMKRVITVDVIRKSVDQGIYSIVYDRRNTIITPEAWDVAKLLSVDLQEEAKEQQVKPQYCGVRPTFTTSDQELLVHTIKHKVKEKLSHLALSNEVLTEVIERVLNQN